MSEAGWAEQVVARQLGGQYVSLSPKLTAELLLAEHKRAVRVVTAEIKRVKLDRHNYSMVTRAEMMKCLDRLLAALQRGRE
jgi:hypothetical protein